MGRGLETGERIRKETNFTMVVGILMAGVIAADFVLTMFGLAIGIAEGNWFARSLYRNFGLFGLAVPHILGVTFVGLLTYIHPWKPRRAFVWLGTFYVAYTMFIVATNLYLLFKLRHRLGL